jgi:hypothetical protein
MRQWFGAMKGLGLPAGESFDLDFHTIPFHGEDALLQKHYVSKRSRRQKGLLAFVAQDADTHVFCYGNAQVRKENQNDEVVRFVEFWKERTGKLPQELIFDSKLTTYGNLGKLNDQGIDFITLRRRSHPMLQEVWARPASAWRQIHLEGVSRIYRDPRVLDEIFRGAGTTLHNEVPMDRLDPQYRIQFGAGGKLDCTPNIAAMGIDDEQRASQREPHDRRQHGPVTHQ